MERNVIASPDIAALKVSCALADFVWSAMLVAVTVTALVLGAALGAV